ncbi:Uncharacterized protein Fot_14503 [Forsythia ovata]|uniref:Agenet domain-containing protein n=1 Tax=Forsythia ovata TaxID=205694 RepID=A0ABD1WA32_9LAMI
MGLMHGDENKVTEFEVSKESIKSISTDALDVADKRTPVEAEKDAPSAYATEAEPKTVDQSASTVDTSNAVICNEVSQKLFQKIEVCPAHDLIIQKGNGGESTAVEKLMEAKGNYGATSSIVAVAVTNGSADMNQSNLVSTGGVSCIEFAQSETDKQESLKAVVAENVPHSHSEVLPMHMTPGVDDVSNRPLAVYSKGEPGKASQAFSTNNAHKILMAGEGSPATSGFYQLTTKVVQGISHGSPLAPDVGASSGDLKSPSEPKTRRSSGKSGKESGKRGVLVKEIKAVRQNERGNKACVSLSQSGTGQLMQFGIQNVEGSTSKTSGFVSNPASGLPDLNSAAPVAALFLQPFTDLQQVQLRAQIFVYGSLIQGVSPDEANMVSAFGISDGGRSIWEPLWQSCVDRLHGQKSQGHNSEMPVQSHSGAKAPDQASKQGMPQNKVMSSHVDRASILFAPLPVVKSMAPLSSPMWNIASPSCDGLTSSSMARCAVFNYQAVSPSHPYRTPPVRNFVANTTSWASPVPFSGPCTASSQSSAFVTSAHYSGLAIPVRSTPLKEPALPVSFGTKHAPPIPVASTRASSVLAGMPSLIDTTVVTVLAGQNSADPKTRKRKKTYGAEDIVQNCIPAPTCPVSAPTVNSNFLKKPYAVEDLAQTSLLARSLAESVSAPVVSSHYSTSVAITTPSRFMPKISSDSFLTSASPSVTSDHHNKGNLNMEQGVIDLEDFTKVEEVKLQTEEAAAHAAAAVSHYEGVWSHLDKQKNTCLMSDAEAKLSTAAVTIAAAASVAKEAAAAAKIASEAALKAKQMADEAVTNYRTASSMENNTIYPPKYVKNLGNANPASILKGRDRNNGYESIISAAKEASRKRIEAASAATRHAENLDSIVKAAELAAEAVLQAGKVISIGNPLPLTELAEAGPDYWKLLQLPSVRPLEPDVSKDKSNSNNNVEEALNGFKNQGPGRETLVKNLLRSPVQRALARNLDNQNMVEESMIASVQYGEKTSKAQKEHRSSDLGKIIDGIARSNIESRSKSLIHDAYDSTASLKDGSLIEVLKNHDNLKGAWFSANVLSLKDGEALVCYTTLQSDGSEQLKEWVSLQAEGSKAPIIRIPHPMTVMLLERTRKRQRVAAKDYAWSIGDRVDAWVQDWHAWLEGVIAEKNEEDEATFTVHFPAQRETSIVKAWHLRPTLIWSDGQWTEWSRRMQDCSSQGDAPWNKRVKMGTTATEAKGKGKVPKNIDSVEPGTDEDSRLLPLSTKEPVFNIGSTRDENKPDSHRTVRSGLQKEGSRVIFGIPKPGKKQKFMEVSKHCVSDRSTKVDVPDDSVKLVKFMKPQGPGSRGWKSNTNIDLNEKQVVKSKPKVLKSGKSPSILSRTLPWEDDSTSTLHSVTYATSAEHIGKGSVSNDENESGFPQETDKKESAVNTKPERLNKGKLAPASGKSLKNEATDKLISEEAAPRRSNRRIQPTSRLLEGLQSSPIIPKISSSSHDKSHRSDN